MTTSHVYAVYSTRAHDTMPKLSKEQVRALLPTKSAATYELEWDNMIEHVGCGNKKPTPQ